MNTKVIIVLILNLVIFYGTWQDFTPTTQAKTIFSNNKMHDYAQNFTVTQRSVFAPSLDIIPSLDGTALFVKAGGISKINSNPYANVSLGPTHHKGRTMSYSDTIQIYAVTLDGFLPSKSNSENGSLAITTTTGLDTGQVPFIRAYLSATTTSPVTIYSADGNLQLTLTSSDTLKFDTYLVIVPSLSPRAPAPVGHYLVSSSYSLRAAAMTHSETPMSLRLSYNDILLNGSSPHTLAIFGWQAFNNTWVDLGGQLSSRQSVSLAISEFTTYAVMTTPTWRDEFNDFNELSSYNHVTLGGTADNRAIVLLGSNTQGMIVSKPITPSSDFASWDKIAFSNVTDFPTTTITVDILTLDNQVVLTNVLNDTDLKQFDPIQYPALKLRANFSSTVPGLSAKLYTWRLGWQVADTQPPTFTTIYSPTGSALITPTLSVITSTPRPIFDWLDAEDNVAVVSYTLALTETSQKVITTMVVTKSIFTPTFDLPQGNYLWTVQAFDMAGNYSQWIQPPSTFRLVLPNFTHLPLIIK